MRTLARESPDIVASWHVDTISRYDISCGGQFFFVFRRDALPMAASWVGQRAGWDSVARLLGIKDGEHELDG